MNKPTNKKKLQRTQKTNQTKAMTGLFMAIYRVREHY